MRMGRSSYLWRAAILAACCAACGGSKAGSTGSSSSTGGSSGSSGLASSSSSSGLALSSGGTGSSSSSSSSSSGGSSTTQAGSSSSGSSGTTTTVGTGSSSSSSGTTSSSSSSSSGGSSSSGSSGVFNDGGYAAGTKCFTNSECESDLCKEVVENIYVCVTPCASQADCPGDAGSFCEATSVGSTSGYCIPGSPTTCGNCTQDSDCGDLTEACIPDPDGGASACHPDCSLAGDAGCPSQYTCEPVPVSGTPRQLCMPNTPSCLDEIGGDCSLIPAAQACTRTNADGSCTGQRTCDTSTNRFSDCSATVPQQLASCSSTQPTDCQELTAPSAVSTVTDCGSCGNACPGNGNTTDVVTCTNQACTFVCVGENYDVDGNPANGCEVAASPQGNHTAATAINLGSYDCVDSDSYAAFAEITGTFPSDTRTHQPAINGFDASLGSAPDFWEITGSGESSIFDPCENDLQLVMMLTGSSNPACYQVTVNPNDPGFAVMTATFSGAGQLEINPGDSDGNYGSGDNITIELSKICSTPPEAPTFAVVTTGNDSHL